MLSPVTGSGLNLTKCIPETVAVAPSPSSHFVSPFLRAQPEDRRVKRRQSVGEGCNDEIYVEFDISQLLEPHALELPTAISRK